MDEAQQNAEKAIKRVQECGRDELDLSRKWDENSACLTELPQSLRQLTELDSLDLYNNRLTVLPDWIGELRGLCSLDLWGNQLSQLPDSLGGLGQLETLDLHNNRLTELPSSLKQLTQLTNLDLSGNTLISIPEWLGQLTNLRYLNISNNGLRSIPECLGQLTKLEYLAASNNQLTTLPTSLGQLKELRALDLTKNRITDLPQSCAELSHSINLTLFDNPLNPELAAAYEEGMGAISRYLHAKAEAQVALHEAKLILVGEGEVGKSCLLAALRDDPWVEGCPSTHGIEIRQVVVVDPNSGTQITLNGWDFGGQRVYRPTHQLFFSAPAVYLVVWKPREGPQQGFVKEWIKLIKHREPDAKVLVVATHGGPKERQPDIDRQEIWDLFGRETVVDFLLVDSKPDRETGERRGIMELKQAIASVATGLPEMGRQVPQRWEDTRNSLKETGLAYLPLDEVLRLCFDRNMSEPEAKDFLRISHRLGHVIHYEHDPLLRDIVVLKPDWLATAISFVLDDKQTRDNHGLVGVERLGYLWNDPEREEENRYPAQLHSVFLRLMERFDLSYRVVESDKPESGGISLIAQLVPDIRPAALPGWTADSRPGDLNQVQICQIVEAKKNQSASAEGLFFQLIVRLHKYSLGRSHYDKSVHWQRGLVLEDDYGARAFLEHVGNDVRITVRSPYPERFLSALTYEVKWLVEHFWAGLRCDVMVPCLNPIQCIGLYEVRKLIENKRRGRPEQPCPVCNEWQNIELLLHNAPAARPSPIEGLFASFGEAMTMLKEVRKELSKRHSEVIGRFDKLDVSSKELVTKVDAAYTGLMRTLLDEAKNGPRLFNIEAVDPGFFDRPRWITEMFRITLWCEHSRLPLPLLNKGARRGVYDLLIPRDWLVKATPFLKLLTGTLSLVVPVASSAAGVALDDISYKALEKQLALSKDVLESMLKGGTSAVDWLDRDEGPNIEERSEIVVARGAVLRELHTWLRERDPSFGGLVRVQNKRQEFLWVHSQFEKEY